MAEWEADPESVMTWLNDFRQRCKDGIKTEKQTARGDVVTLREALPKLELAATVELVRMFRYVVEQAEKETEGDREVPKLVITYEPARTVPKDLLDE